MKNILLVVVLFISHTISTQNSFFNQVDSIKVISNGNELNSPWMGGINAAQFSKIDVNNDGLEDLFIFDRTGNTISIYINNGTTFTFNSDYSKSFPPLEYWALLRDFNKDGKKRYFLLRFWWNRCLGKY